LIDALEDVCRLLNVPFFGRSIGGMFGFCFTEKESVINYADVAASDDALFKRFYHGMLKQSIYFAPSLYEAGFMSSAHQIKDIEETQASAAIVLAQKD
jgi:glutamate-1-semialdehyde 2,1-aminomutase